MDEGTKTQTVRVNATDTQTITVYNTRIGGLTIIIQLANYDGSLLCVEEAQGLCVSDFNFDGFGCGVEDVALQCPDFLGDNGDARLQPLNHNAAIFSGHKLAVRAAYHLAAPWYLPDKDADRVQTISLLFTDANGEIKLHEKGTKIISLLSPASSQMVWVGSSLTT